MLPMTVTRQSQRYVDRVIAVELSLGALTFPLSSVTFTPLSLFFLPFLLLSFPPVFCLTLSFPKSN